MLTACGGDVVKTTNSGSSVKTEQEGTKDGTVPGNSDQNAVNGETETTPKEEDIPSVEVEDETEITLNENEEIVGF